MPRSSAPGLTAERHTAQAWTRWICPALAMAAHSVRRRRRAAGRAVDRTVTGMAFVRSAVGLKIIRGGSWYLV